MYKDLLMKFRSPGRVIFTRWGPVIFGGGGGGRNRFFTYPTRISVNPTGAKRKVVLHEGCKTTLVHDISMIILTFLTS